MVSRALAPDEAQSPAEPRRDRTSRQSRARTPVSVELTSAGPKTVKPNSTIGLTGTVTNRSGQAYAGVQYRLRYSSRVMNSRGQLDQVAAAPPAVHLLGFTQQRQLGQLAATGKASWRLTAKAKDLRFSQFGAYAIGVEFFTSAGVPLGGQVTFVTYLPAGKKPFKDTSVGWVLPMIDRVHRTEDDTFFDDRLETDLAPTGRLGGLVEAAAKATKTPVTWAVDPALLDDADKMTSKDGYVVKPPGKKAVDKPSSKTAKAWLDRLKVASDHEPYFAVPYADVDADALIRNGMSKHLALGYKFTDAAQRMLGRPPTNKIAWPVPGVSETRTLNAMVKNGSDTFLMSSAAFQPADQRFTTGTTTSVRTYKGDRPTVVYDAKLSDIVSADTRSPGARVLAEQRFLAETAMITNEQPNVGRAIVIAPSRRWNPDPVFARELLSWADGAAWLRPGRVDQLAAAAPKSQLKYTGYPPSYSAYELGRKYLGQVKDIGLRATHFGNVLDPRHFPYEKAVLRLESSSWRGNSTTARRARSVRDELSGRLTDEIDKVHLVLNRSRTIPLAGRTGRIPISVTNKLPDQSVSLQLKVTSRNRQRLQIGRYEPKLDLAPGETWLVWVDVKSYAQGNAAIDVELLTPQGARYRRSETAMVNTTGYGPIALLITGGGIAVLFVGVGFRAMRARRRNKLEAAGDGPPGGEPPWGNDPSPLGG